MLFLVSFAVLLGMVGTASAVEMKVDWDPDAYTDLALKFKVAELIIRLLNAEGKLAHRQALLLNLTGVLSDGTQIEGSDCVILVGNVPKFIEIIGADTNKGGRICRPENWQKTGLWRTQDSDKDTSRWVAKTEN
ncbi:MAG: hypothetical protein ACYS4W_11000 [Planctomycetota bacterium]